MSLLIAATRAEFAKVFTTRIWWILLLILGAYVALLSGGLALLFGATSEGLLGASAGAQQMPTDGLAPTIYSTATSIGYVFPFLLGALATTGEFRHQTLTPTFLATPKRGVVLLAKAIALFLLGAAFGVVALACAVGAGSAGLAGFGIDTALDSSDTWAMIARSILAMAIWSVLGVGLGSIIPNQVAAIVIVLAFTQFVEPILRSVGALADWIGQVTKWLPGAASDALVGSSFYSVMGTGGTQLDWWAGGAVLLGIALIVTILGWLITWRHDVT
ncbi:ABC transporter permease [Paramicrobacterium chengjingii]|uniref:ABC transporter permease n=1 Tax=Paramicrobacterium chengjingii TaxID=2769067 RepID=UPI001FD3BCCF|nr:ABC transporter permease [Microbacterium chengjingii]